MHHTMFEEHARDLRKLRDLTSIVEQHLRAGKYGQQNPHAEDDLEGNHVTDLHALVRHARKTTE